MGLIIPPLLHTAKLNVAGTEIKVGKKPLNFYI